MNSVIALIGSIVIGSLLLMSIMTFQADLKKHTYKEVQDLIVQDRAMGIIELIHNDFKDIGFGTATAFAVADSDNIKYYVDLGDDGITDSVRYFISDTAAASGTPNPQDILLYRVINNAAPVDRPLGVTDFKLKYFDNNGLETNILADIKTLEISLKMESTSPHNEEYSRFFWREKITPPSLVY